MKSNHVIQVRSYNKGEKSECISFSSSDTNVSIAEKIRKWMGV